jgi:pyridoxal phosphate enzyme (YggS family)
VNRLAQNLAGIHARIAAAAGRAARSPDHVRLVAVTKGQGAELVHRLLELGQQICGENRVQEARRKFAGHPPDLPARELHLIGHLQSNKAALAARLFDMVHSVDSLRLAETLARGRLRLLSGECAPLRPLARTGALPVLVQVNTTREGTKSGVSPELLGDLLPAIAALEGLELRGLMTMASAVSAGDPDRARPAFGLLRNLASRHRSCFASPDRVELSMGMSGDLDSAVEEGATMVRVGSALFAGENGDGGEEASSHDAGEG